MIQGTAGECLCRVAYLCKSRHQFCNLVGRQKCFVGSQDWSLRIQTAHRIAFRRVSNELLQQGIECVGLHHHAIPRQVLEQRGSRFEKQWQVVLNAAVRNAVGNVAIDARLGGLALEAFSIVTSETRYGVFVEWNLACGQDADGIDLFAGQLVFRREKAQRFDIVIEEINSHRRVRAHRKDVNQ